LPASVEERAGPHARPGSAGPGRPAWYALHTQSHCEELVRRQLAARGLEAFLPRVDVWSSRGGVRRLIRVPMFPGYLFLHDAMDRATHVEVRKARGLVSVLGEGWERLAVVADEEIAAVRRLADSRLPAMPHPYLREGRRVRIVRGPLADLEGILLGTRPDRGLLVLSLHLLQRSVAVEIDCTHVAAA
jgi:transcription antitermination factor NusG